MTDRAPAILGLGLASPAHTATQTQATALGISATLQDPSQAGLVAGLYARAGVDRRASVVVNSSRAEGEPLDQAFFSDAIDAGWPTTAQRMRAFEHAAGELAIRAACAAMHEAGRTAEHITDLITVSCTGLGSPGVDVSIMSGLGLAPSVRRINIGFMGCHGAIVALRTASALAAQDPANGERPCVLAVCVELCSLHLQRTARVDRHVSNALFADGCGAMVIAPALSDRTARAMQIVSSSSTLFPNSTSAMGWQIGDSGFEMTLDRGVPELLERHLAAWIWPWLRSSLGSAVLPGDVRWAIHPGGPRILDAVARSLSLNAEQADESRTVLRNHGNMSSPTVLYIVDRIRAPKNDRRPIVMLAFGPGLTGEAALIQPTA